MEGNLSSRKMMQGNGSFGGFDLQGPLRVNHQHHQHSSHPRQGSSMVPLTIHENFPLTIGTSQDCEQTVSVVDFNKVDRGRCGSDEDEPSIMEDYGGDGRNLSKEKKASTWQRVKWSDNMVRLLITAVSYINEDAAAEHGSVLRRKYSNLQKKGKWKSVSKVMAERGHFVSPQQCEDKFNDLNKRYKRLNEILGRGTSCTVVEKPGLLDVMDHISEKAKDEVRKILSSKHLHYEEMCSYHNGNRLHLPPDPELQRSLRLALRSRDDHDDNDVKRHPHEDTDQADQEGEFDDHGESEEVQAIPGDQRGLGLHGCSAKRAKQSHSDENFGFKTYLNSLDCNKTFNFQSENADSDVNQGPSNAPKGNTMLQKQWISQRHLQLEEQRMHLDLQKMELERERFKWQRFCRKKDRELETMKMEIERMKLENERMVLELRQKQLEIDNS